MYAKTFKFRGNLSLYIYIYINYEKRKLETKK